MLVGCLRVLFGHVRMLLAFGVVALAVMFGGRAVSLGCVFVVFGCLVVFVVDRKLDRLLAPSSH